VTDAGKAALYLQSILEELQLEQLCPTDIQVDNRGARQLTNVQQPSQHTQYIDMQEFCILQWTEEELIIFTNNSTSVIPSPNQQDAPNFMNTWAS
jgi:hypothetical protein